MPEDFRAKTEKGRRGFGNENCSLGIKEMCCKGRAQNPEHRREGGRAARKTEPGSRGALKTEKRPSQRGGW